MIGKCLESLKITFYVVIPSLFNAFAMRALGFVSCGFNSPQRSRLLTKDKISTTYVKLVCFTAS